MPTSNGQQPLAKIDTSPFTGKPVFRFKRFIICFFRFLTFLYDNRKKSSVIAYILWLFLGIFGVHRFYVGDFFKGILLFFTLGGFIIGWLVDFVFLQKRIEEYNDALEIELLAKAIEDTQADSSQRTDTNNSVYDVRKEMDEDMDL